jgi:hypothetical protein
MAPILVEQRQRSDRTEVQPVDPSSGLGFDDPQGFRAIWRQGDKTQAVHRHKYLINLPGYGSVIMRSQKETFETAVIALEKYIKRFQRQAKKKLQAAIDSNRRVLTGVSTA